MRAERSTVGAGCGGTPHRLRRTMTNTVLLALPSLILCLWPAATDLASFDRVRIAEGQVWRVVTGHWTHWTAEHLAWDLLAFVVLVPLCLSAARGRTLATLAGASVLIPATIWIALPGMLLYRGLSGLDSALFVLLGATLLRREIAARAWGSAALFGLALGLFAAKVGFEMATGAAVFVESEGFVPVPLAHLVGGSCGLIAAGKV